MRKKLLLALMLVAFVANPTPCRAQFGRPVIVPHPAPVPHVGPHVGGGHGGALGDGATTAVVVVLSILALLTGVGLVAYWRKRARPAGLIRIVTIPPGEAPEDIRRAWVGLELPLVHGAPGPVALDTEGVLSHHASGVERGYVVDGKTAVRLLASGSPAAADWWRENAPHIVVSGYQLIFPVNVCERMDGASP